ncbi:hypothetical protein [Agromyces ramosus]|uniref:Uncharacterized protein n=1 Tax=Agromyces ramosus TaxID=33879 RepID=A0ABU0R9X0_9MICO|nr:hypothetical protein [Agromyces ramosus]MDQ0894865.1 hypothetical protein [Agromyces ramosus]
MQIWMIPAMIMTVGDMMWSLGLDDVEGDWGAAPSGERPNLGPSVIVES